MLNRRHRFHGLGGLRTVYRHGRNVRAAALNLKVAKRQPNKPYRVAVVVSRKVSKSAVVRNRIRRRVYEAVRTSQQEIAPGTDLVFTAYSDQLAEMSASKLQTVIDDLIGQASA